MRALFSVKAGGCYMEAGAVGAARGLVEAVWGLDGG